MTLTTLDPHPEIPTGHYCYGSEDGVHKDCPHWQKTEKGARCDLLNEEHHDLCMWHLVWDQVKECGIKVYPDGEKPYRNPQRPEGVERTTTCECGKQVRFIEVVKRGRSHA